MPILSIDHIQIAIPIASEGRARAFYSDILGFNARESENPRYVFFLFSHSKRVATAFSLPRARFLPSPCC